MSANYTYLQRRSGLSLHNMYTAFYVIFVARVMTLKEDTFNVNDILNEDLMPTYFLDDHKKDDQSTAASQIPAMNGSVDAAFSTLNFHRKMMNEYQCRNFVAEQILEEMGKNVIQDRVGKPFDNLFVRRSQDPRSNLFYDPGSANYQDWLAKVMAFNDVHKHHNMSVGSKLSQLESTQPHQRGYQVMETEADVGLGDSDGLMYDVSKHVGGYEYSMQPPPPPLYHHSSAQNEVHEEYGDSHGLGIADLFEISLTGIAFLSFGMFILQVLMCITMNHPQTQLMQFVDNADTVNVENIFRTKRETENNRSISALNSIARYALIAIKPQSTACLYRSLCLGNKHAREIRGTSKYWLPLWYAGVSWVRAGSGGAGVASALRAAALGLGAADCIQIYKEECKLEEK